MKQDTRSVDRLKAALVLLATVGMIAFNALAATGYVNDTLPATISAKYPTVLTPAGYAFSIWSVIYLGMLAFSLYQFLPSKAERFRGIRTLYILSCVLNCAWIFFWHREMIGVCLLIISGLFGLLLLINIRLNVVTSAREALFTKAPFGLYFGWLTMAMIVNFAVFLNYVGFEMGQTGWNVFGSSMIIVGALLALAVRVWLRNFLFPLSIAWASTAIAIQQRGNTPVIVVSAMCVVVCLVLSMSFVMDLPDSTHE